MLSGARERHGKNLLNFFFIPLCISVECEIQWRKINIMGLVELLDTAVGGLAWVRGFDISKWAR